MCVSGSFAGLAQATCIPNLRLQFQTTKAVRLANTTKLHVVSTKAKNSKYGFSIQSSGPESARVECSASLGMNQGHQRFRESRVEPFWVTFSKELLSGLRSLVMFLAEQPGQLKYIEWPSFQSTLKTATLTLVLVAVLIVALSSVDSALCYLLALMLRKSA